MKNNYTAAFLLLFAASILGGFALNGAVEYSTAIGFGLGIVFLLLAAFLAGKNKTPHSQSE
ncbi:hypothetical protein [Alkalicoccus halolimnae]|uniref:Uncharacterized protein n=1 Tax=Alkalicoccus halolimnae TaxID=1667239 RepID=A0A5C7FF49_9BACI|nr:hypothetical protein [Alkalicoccus halolimnae]TXF85927.1 hypothetical protein FTX54_07575 [Alkalicoccus halolimnae]